VITGFEAADMLQAIFMILRQLADGRSEVENQYLRCVSPEGNAVARQKIAAAFADTDAEWRGLGSMPESGLTLRPALAAFDAARAFGIEIQSPPDPPGCACGEVLRGQKTPRDCRLFAKACSPKSPVGACMVSSEGTCAAYYRYARRIEE